MQGYPEETYPEYDIPCRRRRYPSVILEEPDQVIPTAEELAERMEKEEEEEEPADNDNMIKDEKTDKNEDEEEEDEEDEDSEEDNDEEDEDDEIGEDQPCLPKSFDEDDETLKDTGEREGKEKPSKRRQITFSDHRHVFHYPKGGAVGCKYEEEEEEEHEDEEDEENEEEENGDEDYEEEEDPQNEEERSEMEEKEEDPLMEAESLGFNDDVECDPEEQEVDLIDFLQTYQPDVTVISSQSQSPKTETRGTLRMRNKKQKIKK